MTCKMIDIYHEIDERKEQDTEFDTIPVMENHSTRTEAQ